MKGPVSGTLFVVATPIGNLEDITLRALRVLREVALVAAEDTRRTGTLLRHYDIATPLLSLHEHNEHRRQADLVRRLKTGESIAVVSDAGTPGIADPGALVVRAARNAGIRVEPIPGPSAISTLLSAAGLSFDRFAFAGFPPVRSKDRKLWFDWVAALDDVPVVGFEAPHRLQKTLGELKVRLGKRPIIIARELTKMHEQWLEGLPAALAEQLNVPRGEFVFILTPDPSSSSTLPVPTDAEIAQIFSQLTKDKGTRREAVQATAQRLGVASKAVYAALERVKLSIG